MELTNTITEMRNSLAGFIADSSRRNQHTWKTGTWNG